MIKLLIVDDHVLFREGLSSLFHKQPDFQVVGEAGSHREAVEMAHKSKSDLILMDFSLGNGTGIEAMQDILAESPKTRIVFLTMHEDDDSLFEAIRGGAKGYLLKNVPIQGLLLSLRELMQKGTAPISREMSTRVINAFSSALANHSQSSSPLDELTDREKEIFRLVAKGKTNQEIAQELVISENTVKNHVHSILEKLGLHNRREAAILAARL